jgi:hypothetical protein
VSLHAGFNFAQASRSIRLDGLKPSHLVLTTDDHQYGGSGSTKLKGDVLLLPPLSAALVREALL